MGEIKRKLLSSEDLPYDEGYQAYQERNTPNSNLTQRMTGNTKSGA